VSSFLRNLVRRGAGVPPAIAPRPALPSSFSADAVMTATPADQGFGQIAASADSVQDRPAAPGERTGEPYPASITDRRPASAPAPAPISVAGPVRREAPTLRPAQQAPAMPSAHDAVSAHTAPEPARSSHATVERDHDVIVTPVPVPTPVVSRTADNAPSVVTRAKPSRVPSSSHTVTPPRAPQSHADAQSRADAHEVPAVAPAAVVRAAALAPATTRSAAIDIAPPAAPDVQVRIGKVEIRASQPVAPPVRATQSKATTGFAELALARAHLNRNYR
jgi:hypothetical protein